MSTRAILEANPEAAHWYVRLRERFDPITRPDWHVDLDRLVDALSASRPAACVADFQEHLRATADDPAYRGPARPPALSSEDATRPTGDKE